MRKVLTSIFSNGELSSKRIAGVIGWLCCLVVMMYCCIKDKQSPSITTEIIVASTTMIGLDSVTNIFKKTEKEEEL